MITVKEFLEKTEGKGYKRPAVRLGNGGEASIQASGLHHSTKENGEWVTVEVKMAVPYDNYELQDYEDSPVYIYVPVDVLQDFLERNFGGIVEIS